ncbi:MAG: hypothetical protein HY897_16970 [Deltaproteobacteria bacterium]|nr:hypothetical protein [Deltaproteobacteria bacterium]
MAYLSTQLDAQSSIRGDACFTALYVRIAGQDRPDLLVAPRGIQVSPAVAETGHPVDITVEVKNAGFADAGAFVVALRSLTVAARDVTVPALAAGATTTLTFHFDDPGDAGVFSLSVIVDPDNAVSESVETRACRCSECSRARTPARASSSLS